MMKASILRPAAARQGSADASTLPPTQTYATVLQIGEQDTAVYLFVTFPNCPLDGSFAVSVKGTNSGNSVDQPQTSLAHYQGGYAPGKNPLLFPANASVPVQVQYWPGATPVPPNAQIDVTATVNPSDTLILGHTTFHLTSGGMDAKAGLENA